MQAEFDQLEPDVLARPQPSLDRLLGFGVVAAAPSLPAARGDQSRALEVNFHKIEPPVDGGHGHPVPEQVEPAGQQLQDDIGHPVVA